MQDLELVTKIQRQLKQLYQNIGDSMISGGVENMEKYKAELPPDAKIKMIETAKQLLPLDEFSLEQNVFRLLNSKDYTNQNEAVKIYRNLHNLYENLTQHTVNFYVYP